MEDDMQGYDEYIEMVEAEVWAHSHEAQQCDYPDVEHPGFPCNHPPMIEDGIGAGPKGDTPILDALIAHGDIWVDSNGDTYVGRASDGVEVAIGNIHAPAAAEAYLTDYSTPDTW